MLKKIVCMLLAALMLAACLPVQAFAQEVSPTDLPSVSFSDLQEVSLAELQTMLSSSDAAEKAADLAESLAAREEAAAAGIASYAVGDNEIDEKEKNNTRGTANVIKNDYTVNGMLNFFTSDKNDYYKITVGEKSVIEIISAAGHSGLKMQLLSSSGSLIESSTTLGYSSGGYYDYITKTLNPGTYYINLYLTDADVCICGYLFYVNWVPYSSPLASGTWGSIKWSLSRDGDLTISGSGAIPDAVYDESTELTNAPWADYWEYIDTIDIQSGVTSIGAYAFTDCYYAEKITIADSVTAIGEAAFWYCENIEAITLPANLQTIGGSAFERCSSLKEITIPAKVTSIGNYAFASCYSMTKINVSSANTAYTSIYGALYDKAVTRLVACPGDAANLHIPSGVTVIGEGACLGCGELSGLTIPDSVKVIENFAFAECQFVAPNLPDGLESIGNYAFYKCGAQTVNIPASVNSIGLCAFSSSPYLKEINVDINNQSYTSIDGVLYNSDASVLLAVPTAKSELDIPDCVIGIETGAFIGCHSLPAVVVPNTINAIGADAFSSSWTTDIMYDGTAAEWNTISGAADIDSKINIHFRGENPLETDVERIAGSSRTETAAELSSAGFESAENVVLASGDNYADALAGGALAYALDAPILLTRGHLDQPTLDEIQRLGAKNIYILGGKLAVGDSIAESLTSQGYRVERIAGTSRFDTAVEIAKKLQSIAGAPEEVYFAYSHNYPDALAISGIAAIKGCPVLYISADGKLSDSTAEFVRSSGAGKAVILGGEMAISSDAEGNIRNIGVAEVTRIAGGSRMETCMKINEAYADILTGNAICIATAYNYPDALAGGVFAAINKAPMLLIHTNGLSNANKDFIMNKKPENIYIFGGSIAVPMSVEGDIWSM